jgi:hypothetical protein
LCYRFRSWRSGVVGALGDQADVFTDALGLGDGAGFFFPLAFLLRFVSGKSARHGIGCVG